VAQSVVCQTSTHASCILQGFQAALMCRASSNCTVHMHALRAQVMSMIPGFSNALMPPGHEKESGAKIKRYMCIMDSMTNAELDASDPKLFTVSKCLAR
jgi:Signal peptide binding domain